MSSLYKRPREEVIDKIEDFIIKEGLKEHERLPSERVMCALWGYNRTTLRSGIKQLILEGKVYSKVGSGIYVSPNKLVRNLQNAEGFYETSIKANRKLKTKVIDITICETSKKIGEKLRLPLGHKVIKIVRLRFLEDNPVMYETVFLDAERFPKLIECNFEELSLYKALKDIYNVKVLEGNEKISIAYCNKQESDLLNVDEFSPVILQVGITFDDTNNIIEYFTGLVRSEYICLASELRS